MTMSLESSQQVGMTWPLSVSNSFSYALTTSGNQRRRWDSHRHPKFVEQTNFNCTMLANLSIDLPAFKPKNQKQLCSKWPHKNGPFNSHASLESLSVCMLSMSLLTSQIYVLIIWVKSSEPCRTALPTGPIWLGSKTDLSWSPVLYDVSYLNIPKALYVIIGPSEVHVPPLFCRKNFALWTLFYAFSFKHIIHNTWDRPSGLFNFEKHAGLESCLVISLQILYLSPFNKSEWLLGVRQIKKTRTCISTCAQF